MMQEDVPSTHWADHVAEDLIQKHPNKDSFVCASGISPSGMVHIGNFREVITVEFVVRALLDKGKKVRFIYSWDDYDAFRKVPVNLPNKELLEKNLRKPISLVPDPYGTDISYAAHFEKIFEKEIAKLGIQPHFIYQNEPYRKGEYLTGIIDALNAEKTIISILNKTRTEPLPSNWTCVSVFCKECSRDITEVTKYTPPSTINYRCKACKKDLSVDFSKEEGVKLLWRVDWPMRWAKEGVDFEPGGKDHSSKGGSYDTGIEIIRDVWKKEPPFYVQYDFVLTKGGGAKFSSSSGNLLTVGEALEVYEPAIIRWIFASRKPNIDFAIAFDLDVLKAYDDFDRCERFAYGTEKGEDRKVTYERRIYEFSLTEKRNGPYGDCPVQFPFRHLCNILQIHEGNLEKAKTFYQPLFKTKADETRFLNRAKYAWKWITSYAPEEFKYTLTDTPQHKTQYAIAVKELITLLRENETQKPTEEIFANQIFQIMKKNEIEPKKFFGDVYTVLINKPQGPKLASFLMIIGLKRSAEILEKSL